MPTIPQLFRHFYPKVKSQFSSRTLGDNTSSGQSGIYTKQSDRARAVSKGDPKQYIDLDSEGHRLETYNAFSHGTRVWTDDVSPTSAGQGEQRVEARRDISW